MLITVGSRTSRWGLSVSGGVTGGENGLALRVIVVSGGHEHNSRRGWASAWR